jgi:lysophospholipase L1-like esterase
MDAAPMKITAFLLALCFSFPQAAPAEEAKPAATANPFAKWEKEIAAMEAADKATPPPKGAVLFIGSSTIRLWRSLPGDFPQHKVINRGFGGSQIVDATHFAPRIVFPAAPSVILLRSGGNDIHAGKSAEQVFEDYKAFVTTVHAKLPDAQIIYLGLCPTIARINEVPEGDKLNALVKNFAAKNPKLKFVDCADMTVGSDGKPRAELFVADKLHLSEAGYKLLAERVRPFMPAVK